MSILFLKHAYVVIIKSLWYVPLPVQSGGYVGRGLEITLRGSLGVRQVSCLRSLENTGLERV